MFFSIQNILDYKKDVYYNNYNKRVGIFPLTSKELSYQYTEDDKIFLDTISFSGKKAEELLKFNYVMPSVIRKKIINEVFYNQLNKFSFLGARQTTEPKELKGKIFNNKISYEQPIIVEINNLFFNYNLVDKEVLSFFVKDKTYKKNNAFFINNVSVWLSVNSAKVVYDMWIMSFLMNYKKYDKNLLSHGGFIPKIIRAFIDNKITTPIEIVNNSLLNKESISFGITTFFMYKESILNNKEFKIESLNKMVEYLNEAINKTCLFDIRDKNHREGLRIINDELNELREVNSDKSRLLLLDKLKINLVNESIEKNNIKDVVKFFENNDLNKEVEIIVKLINDFKNQELTKDEDKYINEIPSFINQLAIKNIELKEFEMDNYQINIMINEVISIKLKLIERYESLIQKKLELLKSDTQRINKMY